MYLDDQIQKTRALLQPQPVEPFERSAAGVDDNPIALPASSWWEVVAIGAVTLIVWGWGFYLIKLCVPLIMALVGEQP